MCSSDLFLRPQETFLESPTVSDTKITATGFEDRDDTVRILDCHGNRLFNKDGFSGLQRCDHWCNMREFRRRDKNGVDFGMSDQFFGIGRDEMSTDPVTQGLSLGRIYIAHGKKPDCRMAAGHLGAERSDASRSDHSDTELFHRDTFNDVDRRCRIAL